MTADPVGEQQLVEEVIQEDLNLLHPYTIVTFPEFRFQPYSSTQEDAAIVSTGRGCVFELIRTIEVKVVRQIPHRVRGLWADVLKEAISEMRRTPEDLDVLARFQMLPKLVLKNRPKDMAGTTSVQSYLRSRLKKWKNSEQGKSDLWDEFLNSEENKVFGAISSEEIETKIKLLKDNALRAQRLAAVGRLGDAAQCLTANGVFSYDDLGSKKKLSVNFLKMMIGSIIKLISSRLLLLISWKINLKHLKNLLRNA
jgi:hypothetical protein